MTKVGMTRMKMMPHECDRTLYGLEAVVCPGEGDGRAREGESERERVRDREREGEGEREREKEGEGEGGEGEREMIVKLTVVAWDLVRCSG